MTEDDVLALRPGEPLHRLVSDARSERCVAYAVLSTEGALLVRSTDGHTARLDAPVSPARRQFNRPEDCRAATSA